MATAISVLQLNVFTVEREGKLDEHILMVRPIGKISAVIFNTSVEGEGLRKKEALRSDTTHSLSPNFILS